MQNKTMLVLLSLLLVAAAATWFFRNFERVTGEITTEASPEVRRNPFLAAERFLAASGREVESSRGRDLLQQLPSPADTLIINHLFESLSSEKAQARSSKRASWDSRTTYVRRSTGMVPTTSSGHPRMTSWASGNRSRRLSSTRSG
ncbi:MAG: hypothetical protein P8Z31_04560 [Gammaproteobacteria bacterium]